MAKLVTFFKPIFASTLISKAMKYFALWSVSNKDKAILEINQYFVLT